MADKRQQHLPIRIPCRASRRHPLHLLPRSSRRSPRLHLIRPATFRSARRICLSVKGVRRVAPPPPALSHRRSSRGARLPVPVGRCFANTGEFRRRLFSKIAFDDAELLAGMLTRTVCSDLQAVVDRPTTIVNGRLSAPVLLLVALCRWRLHLEGDGCELKPSGNHSSSHLPHLNWGTV